MIIGIDKGHTIQGGGSHGACGLLKESVENRKVGDLVISKLRLLGHTVIDCSCNYSNNVNTQLNEVVRQANKQHLDLFLSLHLNAGGGVGAEIYTTNPSGASEKAKKLINVYCEKTGLKNRGYKTGNFYVLRNTKAPAMLLEMAFVDSENDFKQWNNLSYDLIANAIVEGITDQISINKPSKPSFDDRGGYELLNKVKYKLVKSGSQGDYVKLLQSALTVLGYNVNGIDGYCGKGCVNAIRQYQKDHGLSADGICGADTWTSILTK